MAFPNFESFQRLAVEHRQAVGSPRAPSLSLAEEDSLRRIVDHVEAEMFGPERLDRERRKCVYVRIHARRSGIDYDRMVSDYFRRQFLVSKDPGSLAPRNLLRLDSQLPETFDGGIGRPACAENERLTVVGSKQRLNGSDEAGDIGIETVKTQDAPCSVAPNDNGIDGSDSLRFRRNTV